MVFPSVEWSKLYEDSMCKYKAFGTGPGMWYVLNKYIIIGKLVILHPSLTRNEIVLCL